MVDETFTMSQVLGVSRDEPPDKNWLDRIPRKPLTFLRLHFGWPKLSPYERWDTTCLIQEEFLKLIEEQIVAEKAKEEIAIPASYEPEYWN